LTFDVAAFNILSRTNFS